MRNILTFDIEDWYHANYDDVDMSLWETYPERVQEPTRRILRLLKETHNSATFFVLGCIAERFPELVREIADAGHEIASHGYRHELVYTLSREEFIHDVQSSKDLLEDVTRTAVAGYRAPSWSVCSARTPWIWASLRDMGFAYDSSVFPFKTFLYGDGTSPPYFHEIPLKGGNRLYEVPPSVLQLGKQRIPFSGGFYLRLLPLPVIRFAIRRLNSQYYPAVIYLHPREIDPQQPRLPLKRRDRFIHYCNITHTEQKLRVLLQRYQFTTIRQMYVSGKN